VTNQEINRNSPIGVFDSGIGGLTVFAAIAKTMPAESLVYLGDTARVPYGTRSPRTVEIYSRRVASHLWKEGIKALVVACNTASTYALEVLSTAGKIAGIPVIGVIEPGVAEALKATKNGSVGVLGTEGTVLGGRYQALLQESGVSVEALACPLFVSLAEEGWTDGPIAELVAQRYLSKFTSSPDTVILGCTHYPMLKQTIQAVIPGVTLIDSAEATARALAIRLKNMALLTTNVGIGDRRFIVTDNKDRFLKSGASFLGAPPEPAIVVDIGEQCGIFAEIK
jgi:glutamate racemase